MFIPFFSENKIKQILFITLLMADLTLPEHKMVKVSYSTGLHNPFCVVSDEFFVSYLM